MRKNCSRFCQPSPRRRALAADQFESISKRIVNVTAPHPGNIVRLVYFNSRVSQSLQESGVVAAAQGWVRFLCGTEIVLDAEMELHVAACEPASATLGEFRWFRHFHHSQHTTVKSSSFLFPTRRHRKLNMIDSRESKFPHANDASREAQRVGSRENHLIPTTSLVKTSLVIPGLLKEPAKIKH